MRKEFPHYVETIHCFLDAIDYWTFGDENTPTRLWLDWLYGRPGVVSCCGARPSFRPFSGGWCSVLKNHNKFLEVHTLQHHLCHF